MDNAATGTDPAMESQKRIDCYFWQYLRALRHELTHAAFMHRIAQIDSSPDEHFREGQSPGLLTTGALARARFRCDVEIPVEELR